MADIDLNALSLAELKQLRREAIAGFEDRRKAEARAKVNDLARELGFNLDELTEAAPSRKRAAAAPKYRHPENPEITWLGRGRKPALIADALASRKSVEEVAI